MPTFLFSGVRVKVHRICSCCFSQKKQCISISCNWGDPSLFVGTPTTTPFCWSVECHPCADSSSPSSMGEVADGIQRRQVLCHARNSLKTQNTTPVHTTQPNTHTCQTLQIPRSNPLRRPNLANPHIQRSRRRLQNTQLPPQNSPHRIAKHQSPCIQSTCSTKT